MDTSFSEPTFRPPPSPRPQLLAPSRPPTACAPLCLILSANALTSQALSTSHLNHHNLGTGLWPPASPSSNIFVCPSIHPAIQPAISPSTPHPSIHPLPTHLLILPPPSLPFFLPALTLSFINVLDTFHTPHSVLGTCRGLFPKCASIRVMASSNSSLPTNYHSGTSARPPEKRPDRLLPRLPPLPCNSGPPLGSGPFLSSSEQAICSSPLHAFVHTVTAWNAPVPKNVHKKVPTCPNDPFQMPPPRGRASLGTGSPMLPPHTFTLPGIALPFLHPPRLDPDAGGSHASPCGAAQGWLYRAASSSGRV